MVENISKEQVLCIFFFFCLEYTESNVDVALQKLEKIKDNNICFENNPYKTSTT